MAEDERENAMHVIAVDAMGGDFFHLSSSFSNCPQSARDNY